MSQGADGGVPVDRRYKLIPGGGTNLLPTRDWGRPGLRDYLNDPLSDFPSVCLTGVPSTTLFSRPSTFVGRTYSTPVFSVFSGPFPYFGSVPLRLPSVILSRKTTKSRRTKVSDSVGRMNLT